MGKELHYCEGCKKEQWFTYEEIRKRGPICPQGCTRNKLVYLGETPEEIKKRKKDYEATDGFNLEVKIEVPEGEEEGELKFRRKPSSGKNDSDDLPW